MTNAEIVAELQKPLTQGEPASAMRLQARDSALAAMLTALETIAANTGD